MIILFLTFYNCSIIAPFLQFQEIIFKSSSDARNSCILIGFNETSFKSHLQSVDRMLLFPCHCWIRRYLLLVCVSNAYAVNRRDDSFTALFFDVALIKYSERICSRKAFKSSSFYNNIAQHLPVSDISAVVL